MLGRRTGAFYYKCTSMWSELASWSRPHIRVEFVLLVLGSSIFLHPQKMLYVVASFITLALPFAVLVIARGSQTSSRVTEILNVSDKECSTIVDIAFVVDSSGSIGRRNWERVKRFLKALVSKLDVSPSTTHLAVISYSTNPRVELRFNGFQDTDEVNRKFDDMLWQRGFTYTDKALQLADRDLFQVSNGMRSSVPKVISFYDNCYSVWS